MQAFVTELQLNRCPTWFHWSWMFFRKECNNPVEITRIFSWLYVEMFDSAINPGRCVNIVIVPTGDLKNKCHMRKSQSAFCCFQALFFGCQLIRRFDGTCICICMCMCIYIYICIIVFMSVSFPKDETDTSRYPKTVVVSENPQISHYKMGFGMYKTWGQTCEMVWGDALILPPLLRAHNLMDGFDVWSQRTSYCNWHGKRNPSLSNPPVVQHGPPPSTAFAAGTVSRHQMSPAIQSLTASTAGGRTTCGGTTQDLRPVKSFCGFIFGWRFI